MDPALLRSVSLIETALQREMVAEEYSVSGPQRIWAAAATRQTYSRRDVLGCRREEKNGATTSKRKTMTTCSFLRILDNDNPQPCSQKPSGTPAIKVREKIHQEPLDTTDSFREVAPARTP